MKNMPDVGFENTTRNANEALIDLPHEVVFFCCNSGSERGLYQSVAVCAVIDVIVNWLCA